MPFITSGTPSEYRRSSFRSHFWRWGGLATTCSRAYVIQSGRKRASASTPNSGGGAAVFWSASGLPELWIASEREHVRAAGRTCSRARVIQSGRKRASASTPNLGSVTAVFWSASDLAELWIASEREHVGAAGRTCSRACVIQSGRKRASASTPNSAGGAAVFWSASGLPELWIASEREHVRAARPACSRAYVIQSGRERQHSKLGWRGGYVLECFRRAGALDRVGTGTRESGPASVFPSLRHPKRSRAPALQTWLAGRLCFGVLPTWRSFGSRRSGNT